MKTFLRIALPAAVLALAGCDPLMYVKLDAPSVAVTQALPQVPGAPQVDVPSASLTNVQFDIGEIIVDSSMQDSRLTVNSGTLAITGTTTASFSGIRSASVSVTKDGETTVVAAYDKATDGALANPQVLVLKPVADVNLVPFLSGRTLTLTITVSGVPPGAPWTSDLTFDFHVVAQKNLP